MALFSIFAPFNVTGRASNNLPDNNSAFRVVLSRFSTYTPPNCFSCSFNPAFRVFLSRFSTYTPLNCFSSSFNSAFRVVLFSFSTYTPLNCFSCSFNSVIRNFTYFQIFKNSSNKKKVQHNSFWWTLRQIVLYCTFCYHN